MIDMVLYQPGIDNYVSWKYFKLWESRKYPRHEFKQVSDLLALKFMDFRRSHNAKLFRSWFSSFQSRDLWRCSETEMCRRELFASFTTENKYVMASSNFCTLFRPLWLYPELDLTLGLKTSSIPKIFASGGCGDLKLWRILASRPPEAKNLGI